MVSVKQKTGKFEDKILSSREEAKIFCSRRKYPSVGISPHIPVTNTSPDCRIQGLLIASGFSSGFNIYVGSRRQAYIVQAPKWAEEGEGQHIYPTQECYAPINSLCFATNLNHNTLKM